MPHIQADLLIYQPEVSSVVSTLQRNTTCFARHAISLGPCIIRKALRFDLTRARKPTYSMASVWLDSASTYFPGSGGVNITPILVGTAASGALPRAGSLGGGELSHGLGALRHGMLGELAGEDKADSGLDLARGHSRLLVVARQLGSLGGNLLKNVCDEGVED